jgi:hypothetical protein
MKWFPTTAPGRYASRRCAPSFADVVRGRFCVDLRADWTSVTARLDARSCANTKRTRNVAAAHGRRRRPVAPGRGATHRRPRAPRAPRRGFRLTCRIGVSSEHVSRPPRSGRRGVRRAGKCPIRRFPAPPPRSCSDRQKPTLRLWWPMMPPVEPGSLHRTFRVCARPGAPPAGISRNDRAFRAVRPQSRVGGVKNLRLQNGEIVFSEGVRGPPSTGFGGPETCCWQRGRARTFSCGGPNSPAKPAA